MATRRWQGKAPSIAQANTFTLTGTWTAADTVTFTYGNKAYTTAVGSTVIATIVTNLIALYNALTTTDYQEHREQTAAVGSTSAIFQLTAATLGKPFSLTMATNSAAGLINGAASSTGTVLTASSGPNDWSTAANWSGNTVPVGGDIAIVDNTADNILYGLTTGVTVANGLFGPNFTGTVGLPKINADGVAYYEYRPDYLKGGFTLLSILSADGGRIKIDLNNVVSTIVIDASGSGAESNLEPILLTNTNTATTINIPRGQVGISVFGGETATLATGTLTMGQEGNAASDAQVRCGSGVTLSTITKYGGVLEVNSAIGTSLTQIGGSSIIKGTGAVAQLTIHGGTVIYNTSGTLNGATIVAEDGFLDFDQDPRAKTVTNAIDCFGAGTVRDSYKVANGAGSLIIDFNRMTGPGGVLGKDWRLTRSATA